MTLRIHDDADEELEAAFDYYEQQRPGLGRDFMDEFVKSTRLISENPERWGLDKSLPREAKVHRLRLKRFPYVLVY